MRAGAIISAFAHAGVLAWVLLGPPKPFDTASGEPVMVDLVTPEEVPEARKVEPPEPPKPPKPEAERPPLVPPRETAVSEKPQTAFMQAQPQPQASVPRPAAPPQPAAQQQPAAPAPVPPPPPPPPLPPETPSIFDPASIPKLLDLTPTPQQQQQQQKGPEYDALADVAAALSGREVAAFKTHLKRCLKLPAGVDAARDLKVVMRVFLKPDGALAADPMLVAAPAAQEGPAMVRAAMQAFKACQPYVLPPEKYNEWKTLDVPLSPRDMAGG
jgi:hypothetical protein